MREAVPNSPIWRVGLLGSFRLERNGVVVEHLSGRREHVLLAYLALTPGTAQPREALIQVFWPNKAPAIGRRYLSYSLHLLQNLLKSLGATDVVQVGGRKTLQLGESTGTDVQEFLRLVDRALKSGDPVERGGLLEQALALYGDGLLPGYDLSWVEAVRVPLERVHQRAVEARPTDSQTERDLLNLLVSAFPVATSPSRQPTRSPEAQAAIALAEPPSHPPVVVLPGDWDRFLSFAQEVEPHLTGHDRIAWLARIDMEYPLLEALLQEAIDERDVSRGLRLAAPLWRYWLARKKVSTGRLVLDQLLAAAPAAQTRLQAKALHALGTLEYYDGDLDLAQRHLEAARATWLVIGDDEELLRTLMNEGIVAYRRADYKRAQRLYDQTISIARKRRDRKALVAGLLNLAQTELMLEDTARARELLRERLDLAEADRDLWATASSLAYLARTDILEADLGTAEGHASRALAISQSIGAAQWESFSLRLLGHVASSQERQEEAVSLFQRAVGAAHMTGDWREIGESLRVLAEAVGATGNTERAAGLARTAADVLKAAGDTETEELARSWISEPKGGINADPPEADEWQPADETEKKAVLSEHE